MKTRVSHEFLAVPLIASFFLTGCVKQVRSTVPAFAQAAELTSTNVQGAFESVNATYSDAQDLHFVVTYDGKVNPSTISAGWLKAEDLNARLQILQGLKQYASELNSLTGSNDVDNLNKASTEVGDSLTALSKTAPFKKITSKVPGNLANEAAVAVNALGNWLIELKLKKNLPTLIEKMDPNIQSICKLLITDIGSLNTDPAKPAEGSGLRQVLWNQYNSIILSQNQYILHNQCNAAEATMNCFSPEARFAEIQKLPALVKQRNASDQALQQVQVTVKALAQAHTELVKAAQTKQNLTADLGDLLVEAQRLEKYYNSLSSNK
jgi:hypothetical protein